jgi:hypothetical protein
MLEEFLFRGEEGRGGWWGWGFGRDDAVCSESIVAECSREVRLLSPAGGWFELTIRYQR